MRGAEKNKTNTQGVHMSQQISWHVYIFFAAAKKQIRWLATVMPTRKKKNNNNNTIIVCFIMMLMMLMMLMMMMLQSAHARLFACEMQHIIISLQIIYIKSFLILIKLVLRAACWFWNEEENARPLYPAHLIERHYTRLNPKQWSTYEFSAPSPFSNVDKQHDSTSHLARTIKHMQHTHTRIIIVYSSTTAAMEITTTTTTTIT